MVPGASGGFIDISFQVVGGPEVKRSLATFGAQVTDLSDAWEQVGEDLLGDFADNFATEGGGFGGWSSWAPLAASTVADRERHGYGGEHPILVRTGELMASTTVRGAPGNVFEVGPNSLTVGTNDPKAVFHQFGTRKMPARVIVGLSWDRQSQIVNRLNTYIQAVARQQGLMP